MTLALKASVLVTRSCSRATSDRVVSEWVACVSWHVYVHSAREQGGGPLPRDHNPPPGTDHRPRPGCQQRLESPANHRWIRSVSGRRRRNARPVRGLRTGPSSRSTWRTDSSLEPCAMGRSRADAWTCLRRQLTCAEERGRIVRRSGVQERSLRDSRSQGFSHDAGLGAFATVKGARGVGLSGLAGLNPDAAMSWSDLRRPSG